jgi:hypothetical protein
MQALDFLEADGVIKTGNASANWRDNLGSASVEAQMNVAGAGIKTAAIVMLHSSYERWLWRMVRFGLVANRDRGVTQIGKRQVPVQTLREMGIEDAIDDLLEKWWDELSREPILKKWDSLVAFMGYPEKLSDGPWHFDREMLSRFDEVRHNAVHHDGEAAKQFDLADFATRLWRAQWVWFVEVACKLNLRVRAEAIFGLR